MIRELRNGLLALAAVLAVAVGPADAAEPDGAAACRGTDILADLARSDPQALAAIHAEAKAEINHTGLLWRIDSPGTAPSYLFGTIHLADPRLSDFPAPVRAALDDARIVAVEVAEIANPNDAAVMAGFMKNIGLLLLGPKGVLDDYLTGEEMEALGEATLAYGLPVSVARSLQLWMVASFLAIPHCELKLKEGGKPAVDSVIARYGMDAGAELVGLETIDEQIAAMNSVNFDYQIAFLRAGIELFGRIDDLHESMVQLYLSERAAALVPLSFHLVSDPKIREGYTDFQEKLVDRRNRRMLERALPHIRDGGTFIAVGALHLPGKAGLIELFRREGFDVTRVDLTKSAEK